MSELPWYERRPVTGSTIAMVAVAAGVLLATPFIDRTWPTKAAAVLVSPWVRVPLFALALGGTFLLGYALGRRRRGAPAAAVVVAAAAPNPPRLRDALRDDLTWDSLCDNERRLLILLWRAEQTFIADRQLEAMRKLYHWDAATWNGIQHSLETRHGLMWRTQAFVEDTLRPGWGLTPRGGNLLAAAQKAGRLELPKIEAPWKP